MRQPIFLLDKYQNTGSTINIKADTRTESVWQQIVVDTLDLAIA